MLTRAVGAWDAQATMALGGWALSVHHAYDPREKVLHRGDGSDVSSEVYGASVTTVAGDAFGTDFPAGEGLPATQVDLDYLVDFAMAPDGSIFAYSSLNRNHIVKIDAAGLAHTYAGKYDDAGHAIEGEPTGDGGPALAAVLGHGVNGLAVGPDGSVYFTALGANYPNGSIRKIDPSGVITTIAGIPGNLVEGNGDGGPARQAKVSAPIDVAVGPDGSIYFGERGTPLNNYRSRIRRIDLNGNISTVAGGGATALMATGQGEGMAAQEVDLPLPCGIAFCQDGSMYVAHPTVHFVSKVGVDGRISRFAGSGAVGHVSDGLEARAASVGNPTNVAVGRDGAFYLRGDHGFNSATRPA